MEKRFDMMDFEESLREHANRFTLTPTRKVWMGLYNDLHPGSKWPSKTMGLLLIFSIIMVGNLNNGSKTIQTQLLSSSQNLSSNKEILQNHTIPGQDINTANLQTRIKKESSFKNSGSAEIEPISERKNIDHQALNNSIITISTSKEEATKPEQNSLSNSLLLNTNKPTSVENNSIAASTPSIEVQSTAMMVELPKLQKDILKTGIESHENFINATESINPDSHIESAVVMNTEAGEVYGQFSESSNKISLKKIRKSTWTFYLTPSVSSAWFNAAPISQSSISNTSPLMVSAANIAGNRKYNSKLSLSAGASSSLPITDQLHFTSGVMLTYLGYQITSNFVHPTFANLVLKDKTGSTYLKSYITHYGVGLGYGQIHLSNYSFQFAVPLGLEYTLLENQKINWKIGSSVAPSVVIAAQSYILSSEGRNYVTDPNLARRFNLIANFETFFTFKSARIKWHIGPSFGYQTLSTFKYAYPEKEHLLDYGIKIGISGK
jgi:hypothetical protein